MKILITGGSGYIGAMLADQFCRRNDVEKILLIDLKPFPEFLNNHPNKNKIEFIQDNLGNNTWQEKAKSFGPEAIIHTAWQIRQIYGKPEEQWKNNIGAADNVLEFAKQNPVVKKLIHFSSVASYGAFPSNTTDYYFTEKDPLCPSDYSYAEEKRLIESHIVDGLPAQTGHLKVAIVRPVAITGPRGRSRASHFGLQSALSGSLKKEKSLLYKMISLWVSLVPATPKWVRQYVHEDDVNDIVELLTFNELKNNIEIFNLAPPGPLVFGKDMAEAVNKKTLSVYPWMVRLSFFFVWHLTRGKIPTSPGSWKGYSYPIVVDGSKITEEYGYQYKFQSKEAFVKNSGRYAILGTI